MDSFAPCGVYGCRWAEEGPCRVANGPGGWRLNEPEMRQKCSLASLLREAFPNSRVTVDRELHLVDVERAPAMRPLLWFDRRRGVWLGRLRQGVELPPAGD